MLKWMKNYATIIYLLTYILIQGLYHGAKSTNIWIYHMFQGKHIRQKSLKKYMRFWRSRLEKLNNMFDTYIKENYAVVEHHVKTPSQRERSLTWKPYGEYKRKRKLIARKRCIKANYTYIIEARAVQEKVIRKKVKFDTDSYDILIGNCCSHTLTNDLNDCIEPPVIS